MSTTDSNDRNSSYIAVVFDIEPDPKNKNQKHTKSWTKNSQCLMNFSMPNSWFTGTFF